MRDALRGVLVGLFLLALFGAIATRAGWIDVSLPRPPGTGAWMLSRATGFLAYVTLSGFGIRHEREQRPCRAGVELIAHGCCWSIEHVRMESPPVVVESPRVDFRPIAHARPALPGSGPSVSRRRPHRADRRESAAAVPVDSRSAPSSDSAASTKRSG